MVGGAVPSKTMREAVLHLSGFQYQGIYGVNYRVKEQIKSPVTAIYGNFRIDEERLKARSFLMSHLIGTVTVNVPMIWSSSTS